jgi:cyclic di-GMP phosphodiesterase
MTDSDLAGHDAGSTRSAQGLILVVDDDERVRVAIARFLQARGFAVETVASGQQALELVSPGRFAIVICDVRMPLMSGLELLPRLLRRDPDIGVLMLSGMNDPTTAGESLALGAMEYLPKPIELEQVQMAVERALHRRSLALEQRPNRKAQPHGAGDANESATVPEPGSLGLAARPLMLLIDMFEARDPFFAGMSVRVARTSRAVCRQLGLSTGLQHEIELAGRLHDVGRLVVDQAVLSKPGPLSPEEFAQVKQHVAFGVEILGPLLGSTHAIDAVRDHHEHWDGGGYPRGIASDRISLGGRILCIADAFVALTSRRPYREALSPPDAFDILSARSGSLLDPGIVHALRLLVDDGIVAGLTSG